MSKVEHGGAATLQVGSGVIIALQVNVSNNSEQQFYRAKRIEEHRQPSK